MGFLPRSPPWGRRDQRGPPGTLPSALRMPQTPLSLTRWAPSSVLLSNTGAALGNADTPSSSAEMASQPSAPHLGEGPWSSCKARPDAHRQHPPRRCLQPAGRRRASLQPDAPGQGPSQGLASPGTSSMLRRSNERPLPGFTHPPGARRPRSTPHEGRGAGHRPEDTLAICRCMLGRNPLRSMSIRLRDGT